mmetsp:Transcript_5843/g.11129  ORF Transcript_5843/g.11129 Transcript_5843/m.11129 type:complete len:176 (+) Transcript_5843:1313-1840(+)
MIAQKDFLYMQEILEVQARAASEKSQLEAMQAAKQAEDARAAEEAIRLRETEAEKQAVEREAACKERERQKAALLRRCTAPTKERLLTMMYNSLRTNDLPTTSSHAHIRNSMPSKVQAISSGTIGSHEVSIGENKRAGKALRPKTRNFRRSSLLNGKTPLQIQKNCNPRQVKTMR